MAFFAAANEETQQIGREQRHEDAAAVEQEEHQGGMVGEESEGEDGVDRQSGGARHEGQGDHREQAALAVLDGAGGHDGRPTLQPKPVSIGKNDLPCSPTRRRIGSKSRAARAK